MKTNRIFKSMTYDSSSESETRVFAQISVEPLPESPSLRAILARLVARQIHPLLCEPHDVGMIDVGSGHVRSQLGLGLPGICRPE